VICADLASSLDPFSIALMRESRRIFVITTPEIVPLHLTGQRVRALQKLGLGDRISLLLNRKSGRKGGLGDAEVANLVGLPISITFSNDYAGVEAAILEASPISRESGLGQSILNLAHSLAPHVGPTESPKRRKVLEFFHISQNEQPDEVWKG
jgi:Flp pilus assembly CpaE family ATPase